MNNSSIGLPDTSSLMDKSKKDISQSTPIVQENIHGKRIFSVDDDPDEVKHDIRYLEGLHDGFHYALHTQRSKNGLSVMKSAPNINIANNNNNNNNTINSPTTTQRTKPKQHRSISKLAILTTPDSGIGFDLNNSIRHEISDNNLTMFDDSNNNNTSNVNTPLDNNNNISERYVIHDGSLHDYKNTTSNNNNDLSIEEIPQFSSNNNNQDLESNNILLNSINNDDRISTTSSIESFTLKERQDAINETHPFGIRIWKPALYKKQRSVQRTADEDIHETKLKHISIYVHISNVIWSLTLGLVLFTIFALSSLLVLLLGGFTQSARDYSMVFFKLSKYLLWPFGKVVYLLKDEHYLKEDRGEGISVPQFYKWVTSYGNRLFFHQSQSLSPSVSHNERLQYPSYGSIPFSNNNSNNNNNQQTVVSNNNNNNTTTHVTTTTNSSFTENDTLQQRRFFGRGEWTLGRIIFYTLFHIILEPIVMIFALITWLFVFTIPMSNILWNLLYHLRKHPLALGFKNIQNSSTNLNNVDNGTNKNILLCTFRCAGWHYYKFTVDGTNVIVVNLIFLVVFTIFDFFVLKSYFNINNIWLTNESSIFILCLASIIPLAFYIGQAVASISAQTSMGVGAVINAFFSTIVEIYLYCIALNRQEGPLVEGSIIGSILGAVLLLPGLSMCGGAWNRKTQRYNPASAGVSSALLIFSTIVLYVPTIIYEIYGEYTVICLDNSGINSNDSTVYGLTVKSITMAMFSDYCYFRHPPLRYDNMYAHVIQPMSISCAIILFLAYIIGLWFTLRTHAKLIWELPITEQVKESSLNIEDGEHQSENDRNVVHEGHEAPNWSRSKSTYILLIATLLYAVIAEILVACVDSVLEDFPGLSPKFLGLTIFALVPNTTEFLNAISFAVHGNVALSMEIGTAYALQVCQLQIPALILYSIIHTWNLPSQDINIKGQMFTLIFPKWDLIGSFAGIFMFTYLYAEGKSNYFKGSMLILIYVIVILGFFYQGILNDGSFDPRSL